MRPNRRHPIVPEARHPRITWFGKLLVALSLGIIIGIVCLYGCVVACGQPQPRISPPSPPIPALPTVAHITNGAKVFKVTVAEATLPVPKADMPAALSVSEDAPHHYYGIVEFKPTKMGIETENEVFYFGLYPDVGSFHRAHGVGSPKFNRKFKAVFKYPSELTLDAACVWQRREGFSP